MKDNIEDTTMNILMSEPVKIGKWGGSTVVPLDSGILKKVLGLEVGSIVQVDYSQLPERIIISFPNKKQE